MRIIIWYKAPKFFWFRVFGIGFCFKNTTMHPLTFSERNGFTKFIRIGNWIIKFLK